MPRRTWKMILFYNLSYKIIAFLIALILWFTILGRRDFITTQTLDVDLIAGEGRAVVSQSIEQVKLKLSGPRTSIKKFMDSAINSTLTIDISTRPEGDFVIDIPINKIELPLGLKIISVKPEKLKGKIIKRKNQ